MSCLGQTTPGDPTDPDFPSVLAEVPSVPWLSAHLKCLNAGATVIGVHDSATGWSTIVTPALFYNFSPRFSLDLSMPVYLYRLAETDQTTQGPPPSPGQPRVSQTSATQLEPHVWDPGDVIVGFHTAFYGKRFTDVIGPSMTLPSGDSNDGLSTGRVTFDVSNHFETTLPRSVLVFDIGGGDSSNLVDTQVTRDYTSLGALAHFQLGLRVPFVRRTTFQSVAYEQLPLGNNKLYTTLTRPGYPDRTVVSGRSVSEDNGFTNALNLPLTRHISLQGYYNRSLRLHLDTVGMGLSFVVRGPRQRRRMPLYFDPSVFSR